MAALNSASENIKWPLRKMVFVVVSGLYRTETTEPGPTGRSRPDRNSWPSPSYLLSAESVLGVYYFVFTLWYGSHVVRRVFITITYMEDEAISVDISLPPNTSNEIEVSSNAAPRDSRSLGHAGHITDDDRGSGPTVVTTSDRTPRMPRQVRRHQHPLPVRPQRRLLLGHHLHRPLQPVHHAPHHRRWNHHSEG